VALAPSARLGPYEVTVQIGAGGMGEVYRARDTRLGRDVAIKVLPQIFAADGGRLARFEREAQLLAALNHPNIAQIHGLEESAGVRALVMELVEGVTLAERLTRPIPIDEGLAIARQIANALEAAHDRGIVHRDLKPANIKVTPAGVVKVLDFGLATSRADTSNSDLSRSPTMLMPTVEGVVLGTAPYMSPEQARGRPVDKRADIWAFGCVLFEMLTGTRAFHGGSTSDVLASILHQEPDWRSLPNRTPRAIRRLLRRCLAKDCNERLHDIADARLEITDALHPGSAAEPVVDARADRSDRLRWAAVFAASIVIAGGGAAWWIAQSRPAPSEIRLEITTPPSSDPASIAISPDGRKILFVATMEGRSRLLLRALDSSSARPLAGTEGALFPFWSPDNRSIGFFMQGKLQRLDLDGGLVRALAVAPNPVGGTWGPDGTVLFAPNFAGPIFRTSAEGGDAVPITHTDPRQPSHQYPDFLPDGKHFLFFVPNSADTPSIYVGDLRGGAPQRLIEADAHGAYAPSRQLLFVREGKVIAQPFDPARLVLTGNPVSVADQVVAASAGLSVSAAGPFIYRAGIASQRQLVWFDRSGNETGRVSEPISAAVTAANPSLSPDGRRVALNRSVGRNFDVWILDLERSLFSRFTFDAAIDATPVWSPDGATIAFNSNRSGVFDLYQKSATGVGSDELLLATPQNKAPVDWSPDGRFLLYRSPGATTGFDLWALPMFGDRKPFVVAQTNFEERDGQFSPDGKWIAYQSNESGQTQVLVQPFPGPGGKLQVSADGGAQVRWRADGRELFYVSPDGRLMAVPIRLAADRRSLEGGAPVPLFATRMGGAASGTNRQDYVVSQDGQRFLVDVAESVASPIAVVLNWKIKP
jgi:serine/threonine protein kinase/Tol biopolymer transport system component